MLVLDFSFCVYFTFAFFTLNVLLIVSALNHFIIVLVFLDLLLLLNIFLLVLYTFLTGSSLGYSYALIILGVAAADTAIGLGLFVLFFKTKGIVAL